MYWNRTTNTNLIFYMSCNFFFKFEYLPKCLNIFFFKYQVQRYFNKWTSSEIQNFSYLKIFMYNIINLTIFSKFTKSWKINQKLKFSNLNINYSMPFFHYLKFRDIFRNGPVKSLLIKSALITFFSSILNWNTISFFLKITKDNGSIKTSKSN